MTAPTLPGSTPPVAPQWTRWCTPAPASTSSSVAIEAFPIGRDERSALWLWATAPGSRPQPRPGSVGSPRRRDRADPRDVGCRAGGRRRAGHLRRLRPAQALVVRCPLQRRAAPYASVARARGQVATLRHSTRRIGTARHSKLSSMTKYSPPSMSMPTILPNRASFELDRW